MKSWFCSVSFWIVFFFIIRLYGITNPPIEISHNWRQCFTGMVARNFEENNDIMHPAVDMEGGKEVAMEFPLFSYLIFLFNKIFGFTHWHGRLINLFFTTAGLYFFFGLIKKIHTARTAFYGTILLAASIFFSFGRKIMPDTFSAALVLGGVYYAFQYAYSENKKNQNIFLLFSALLLSLGILSKIPSLTLGAFLLFPFTDNSVSKIKKTALSISIIVSLLFAFGWYAYWNPFLLGQGSFQLYFPMTLLEGLQTSFIHLGGVAEKFYFSALSGYLAFTFFTAGIILIIYKKENKLLSIFLLGLGFFSILILKTSNFFYFHNYYIIPFVPFMAVIAGYCITQIKSPALSKVILLLMITESLLNQQHDFRNRNDMAYKTDLENLLNKYTDPTQKIILNTGPNPQQLYFANRKGWLLNEPENIKANYLDSISSRDYSIVVLDKKVNTTFESSEFEVVSEDIHYLLLRPKR